MIDHKYHLDKEDAVSEEGEVVSQRFQKRTQKWTIRTMKEEKDYVCIAHLMARILRLCSINTEEGMLAHVSFDSDDPRRIAPTIASLRHTSKHRNCLHNTNPDLENPKEAVNNFFSFLV